MNKHINFSVVITTHNRLPLLKRAIESAFSQSIPCEVVVADDCSTDGTEEYCHSLGGRIIYHRNQSRPGRSMTVNEGVKIAKGDWIKLLDDDDYLAPNCIEEMIQAIARHPQAVICSCQAINVDKNVKEIGKTGQRGPGKVFYIPQEDIHYGMLMESVPLGTASQVAFRRDAFLKTGGWDSKLDVGFDEVDSYVRIAQFGDTIFINDYLIYYTIWQGGYTRRIPVQERLDRNILIKERIYELIEIKHKEHTPDFEDIKDYLRLHWGIVALKQGAFLSAVKIAFPAIFSFSAWRLLAGAILARRRNYANPHIRKIVLY